jgi:hypothetical protein
MPIRDEDKMQLEQACLASMQAAKTGSVGITMADYIYIKELMAINNMRAAWVYLSYREEQMQKQRDATAAQMQQMNAQQAQQQEVMKKKLEFETAMAIEKVRERNMKLEYYYKMQLEKVKQTGQLPDDLVGEVQMIRQQDEQQAQAEAQAQEQQQMAAQQQQQMQ